MNQAVKKGMEYEAWLKKQADDRKKAKEKKVGKKGKRPNKRERQRDKCIYEGLFRFYSLQCL